MTCKLGSARPRDPLVPCSSWLVFGREVIAVILGLGLFLLCGAGALVALAGAAAMALPGRPQPWPEHLLRRAAVATACGAAAVYSLGLFGVLASEHAFGDGADSVPAPACRDGIAPEVKQGLSHHRASYLPLRFDCVRDDGTVYPSDPDYVWMNWTAASLALATATLAIGAGYAPELRARRTAAVPSALPEPSQDVTAHPPQGERRP
jgi:hypothetical protein